MTIHSLPRTLLLAMGILTFLSLGCVEGSLKKTESNSKHLSAIDPQNMAMRMDNLRVNVEGKDIYRSEFDLSLEELIKPDAKGNSEWEIDGWDVFKQSLQNRNDSSIEFPFEVDLLDIYGNIWATETFLDCGQNHHKHTFPFLHTTTPGAIRFSVGKDVAVVHLQQIHSQTYLHFTLTFECWKEEYKNPGGM